jgi:uncharacterized protein (TIGR03435 family)
MGRTFSILLLAVFVGTTSGVRVAGQTQSDQKQLAFDVAAVKENKSGSTDSRLGGPPSRFTATNLTAFQLITFAYGRQDFEIESAPDWAKADRFDITAKADGDFPIGQPDSFGPQRAMLRSLLTDRFKLVTHTASKQLPIYALITARANKALGPQLRPSNTDCAVIISARLRGQGPAAAPLTPDGNPDCSAGGPPGRITAGTQPMTWLAGTLSQLLQRSVVDRTGLTGTYSFTLTWTPESPVGSGPDAPPIDRNEASIFTALQEQLGLKLESTRGPVDVLVIDHVERPVSD